MPVCRTIGVGTLRARDRRSRMWRKSAAKRIVEGIMLILDTEMEKTNEYPTAGQILQSWAARLWAWLRRQPQPRLAHEESIDTEDCGTGLIL